MIRQILLFGLTFIVVFLLCEFFIRTSHLAGVSTTEFYLERGRGKRPNLDFLMFNEGFGIGSYNQYTYLGEARPQEKPENTIRVILMGDSFVESWQVFERDRFDIIAEEILQKQYPDVNIEVMNFGHSNLHIGYLYSYYELFAKKFNPDLTLFMLADYNLTPKNWDQLRPKTIIENDSLTLTFDYNPSEMALYEKTKVLTQNFSLFHMLNKGRKKAQSGLAPILLDKVYYWLKPQKPNTTVTEAEPYEVDPVVSKILEELDKKEIVFVGRDVNALPEAFKDSCIDHGYSYFDFSGAMQEMIDEGNDPYEWTITNKSGHWNHKGHQRVGEEIAREISLLIKSKSLLP